MAIFCDYEPVETQDWFYDPDNNYTEAREPAKCSSCGCHIEPGDTVRRIRYAVVLDELEESLYGDPDNKTIQDMAAAGIPYELEFDGDDVYVVFGIPHEHYDIRYYHDDTIKVFFCEKCADMSFSLEELGYCYYINVNVIDQWREYITDHGVNGGKR